MRLLTRRLDPLARRARAWSRLIAQACLLAAAQSALLASPTRAQEQQPPPVQQLAGGLVSHAEVVAQLRLSGLSPEIVRSRLEGIGANPQIAEQYLEIIQTGSAPPLGNASEEVVTQLENIGLVFPSRQPADTVVSGMPADAALPIESQVVPEAVVPTIDGLPIFGLELFRRPTSQFQPVAAGPVDPDYRLGPGDQISLVLTGDVEAAHMLEVTREGDIIIPDVGQVLANGLTLRQLEDRLYSRLGEVYSGISRGADATAHFQVSMGRLRSLQVFLIGEVERPGAYQVSSLSTVFNALYAARGPTATGSLRRVQVRRGGQVIRTIDVYEYLLLGDSRNDIRLEQGDVIFVPIVGRQVSVKGSVRRPAVYELDEDDRLQEVLAYAGGIGAGAQVRRVQIDRILPPAARQPGVDRVLVDVNLENLVTGTGESVALHDGDVVQVFAVSGSRRNRLIITGGVRRAGVFEWRAGMTLGDLVERADGLAESAYTPRAHIYRINMEDGSRRLVRTSLLGGAGSAQDVVLADLDSVVVFSRADLRTPEEVTIRGHVKNGGTYALAEGMTVRDLILAAGGFREGADTATVDVARRPDRSVRTDTTALIYEVSLSSSPVAGGGQAASHNVPTWLPAGDEFALRHEDQVFVRRAEGYVDLPPVTVAGEVATPGVYVLQSRQERLTEILRRAGWLTSEASPEGLRLVRGGSLVATDLPRAVARPESRYNLLVEAGDSIFVPAADPTVLVRGAVGFESRVLFEPGKGLGYYIDRAGGYRSDADKSRVSIEYQDGERATVDRVFGFRTSPSPRPGSTINVPAKPAGSGGFNLDQALSRTLSVVTSLLTIMIAVDRLQ